MTFRAFVFVPDLPGRAGFVTMAVSSGMALSGSRQLPIMAVFVPAMVSVLFAGLRYIFVMPQLSSFLGLDLMLFAVTFAICYPVFSPRQALGRALGLAMRVVVTSITNE